MLAARIQPSYLTTVCQFGFKECLLTNEMDYCAHTLHDCIGTKIFTQPTAIILQKKEQSPSMKFTDKENKINKLRCKKQKFYAMFLKHLNLFY